MDNNTLQQHEDDTRHRLANGPCVVNGWMSSPSPFAAEQMIMAGYDSITIDIQHGLIGYSEMLELLRTLSGTGVIPVVRLGELAPGDVGRVLDAGAQVLICPLINTREQAEALVRAAKYPPMGIRSFGPARAARRAGQAEYFEVANDEAVILAMIETVEAMGNLDSILDVPGIDGAYVGPADLSISLGLGLPKSDVRQELVTALATVQSACDKRGKLAGAHQVAGIAPHVFRKQGYRLVTSGFDSAFLYSGAVRAIEAARGD